MAQIQTYVFLDLETSGMPTEEVNRTKITELSMIAVKRQHVLDCRPGSAPRVQHKLTLCFNPGRLIQPGATDVTGLSNDLLENEPYFDIEAFNIINTFLNILPKPVCLVAQNGMHFDYPILKAQLIKLKVTLHQDLKCADCYHAFYDILEGMKKQDVEDCNVSNAKLTTNENNENCTKEEVDEANFLIMKSINETTPKRAINNNPNTPTKEPKTLNKVSKARRRFPWSAGEKPKDSYKLKDIYDRLLNKPAPVAHRAENDCVIALECSIAISKKFVLWVDENNVPFSDINAMTIGVPLGS